MIAALVFIVGLVLCWVVVRLGVSEDTGHIEQRASKADLDFVAKLAARRHAELHGQRGRAG